MMPAPPPASASAHRLDRRFVHLAALLAGCGVGLLLRILRADHLAGLVVRRLRGVGGVGHVVGHLLQRVAHFGRDRRHFGGFAGTIGNRLHVLRRLTRLAGRGRHRACEFVQLARVPQRVQTGDEAPELRRCCRCRTRRQGALLCSGEQRLELLLHFGQEGFCRPVCPGSGERPITWCRRAVEQRGATGNRQCERDRTERRGMRSPPWRAAPMAAWVEGGPVGSREPACCALKVIFGPRIASVCRCKPARAPQLPAEGRRRGRCWRRRRRTPPDGAP